MKQHIFCFFIFISISLFSQEKGATPLPSKQTEAPTQQTISSSEPVTRAIVIGISDYQDEDIPDLKFAHRDARAFANWLHLPGGKNIQPDNIMLLLNEDATLGKVAAAIDWLYSESNPGDQSIIYFSGHGDMEAQMFGLGHLLLWDSPAKAYIAGGLPVERLQAFVTALSVTKNNQVLLVTDACHSGKLAGNDIVGNKLTNANLATQFSNEQKILSCQPDEYSIEGEQWGGGRGAFSWHLINGLCGLADKNGDKAVTLLEIEQYLQDHVPPEVEPLSQIPMTVGDKNEVVGTVDEEMIALLEKGDDLPIQSFSRVEQRGIVQEVLAKADTSIIKLFEGFVLALDEKRLIEPVDDCAESYYNKLIRIESIAPLHSYLRRNLAATFQEDAQQAINAYLLADQKQLNKLSRWDDNYRLYPLYMQKAVELLGPENHFYKSIVARQKYFEGLFLRLFFDVVHSDTLFNRAVQKLEESLELEPDAPYVYQELGLLYDRRQDKETAVKYFREAIERAPSWIVPYLELHEIFRYIGFPEDWYEIYNNAFSLLESKSGPLKWRAYAMRSVIADMVGKGDESVAIMKECLEIEGADEGPWYYLGSSLRGKGRLKESVEVLENAMILYPDKGASYWEMGLTKYEMGEIDEFIALHEKGIDMEPYRAFDYLRFIDKLLESGRYEKALEVIERLFQLDPAYHSKLSNASSLGTAALIFEHLGRKREALTFNTFAIDSTGDFMKILSQAAEASDSTKTKESLQFVLNNFDLAPFQIMEIGQEFYLKKNPEFAELLFHAALEKAPNDLNLINNIGAWYIVHGDYIQAEKYWQLGKNTGNGHVMFYDNLFLLYFFDNEFEKAQQTLAKGKKLFPENNMLYEFEAILNYFWKYDENSKQQFERVEEKTKGFTKVWHFLEYIRKEQYPEAVQAFKEIDKQIETFPIVHYYIGALQEVGDTQAITEVLHIYEHAGGIDYRLFTTHPFLESLRKSHHFQQYLRTHFPEKFDDILLNNLEEPPFPYQANYNRLVGLSHRYFNKYDEAIKYFTKSLETEPDNAEANIYLADLYLKTARKNKAEDILPESMVSKGLEVNWVAAEVNYLLKHSKKAEHYFREFVKLANDKRYPNNRVGAFYKLHGEFDLAESFFHEDIRLHPDDKSFPPTDCRCETNLEKKDIRLHPTNLTSRLNLALVHFFSNNSEKSFAILEESIRQEPGQLSLQALLAFLHYIDNPETAAPFFSKANAMAPGFYQLWQELELMRSNQFEAADQAWESISKRFSDWWIEIVKYQYMKMKVRQGKMDHAILILEALLNKGVFVNYQFYKSDNELEEMRKMSKYQELIQVYFPEKSHD